jgi:hexosaminidase
MRAIIRKKSLVILNLKILFFIFLLLIFAVWLVVPGYCLDRDGDDKPVLMPYPEKVMLKEGLFRLDEKFYVGGETRSDNRAYKGVSRFMSRLAGRTGLFFEQDFLGDQRISEKTKFFYRFKRTGKLLPNEDESYFLDISAEKIELMAKTDIGILHGLETLLQLLSSDSQGYYFPCLHIEDRPRFTWRGLLVDSCRHFMPLEVIKRNLLAMAAVKLNVLHWHLSEDQGFRVESKSFPRLHQLGSDGMFYTREQIKEIILIASDLGIRVMPEFDIPGHSTSWFVGYPEYASRPGPYQIERKFGVFHPVFNPANKETYKFLDIFFREMTSLFPDPYFHIGGDEVEAIHWKENPEIQKFMQKNNLSDNHTLQAYFNQQILKILTKHNKKMVGWDEIYQPGLPKDIVIQSWRGTQALIDGAQKGYQEILSNGYYIDLCETAERHYLNDPVPPDSPLTPDQRKLILGGEATMWAELISPETVDSRIWPRTAAIAERLWSPAEVRDVEDMYKRLKIISIQLEETGVQHLRNQEMMLRRLAQSEHIETLRVLASVCEPVKGYSRHSQSTVYTSLAPLTRFVDVCFPESLEARDFRKKVEGFIITGDKEQGEEIKIMFQLWKDNHKKVAEIAELSPAVKEIVSLSENLATMSSIGEETLEYILNEKTPELSWLENQLKILDGARKPQAECQVAILPAVELLLNSLKK